jgi:FAD binding domain
VRARYLVGCDGAHGSVRQGAGIPFEGGRYPHTFALGDLEADGGLERDAAHAFIGSPGVLFFFPLGPPASWRMLGMRPTVAGADEREQVPGEPSPTCRRSPMPSPAAGCGSATRSGKSRGDLACGAEARTFRGASGSARCSLGCADPYAPSLLARSRWRMRLRKRRCLSESELSRRVRRQLRRPKQPRKRVVAPHQPVSR